jgi:hypothetical protein
MKLFVLIIALLFLIFTIILFYIESSYWGATLTMTGLLIAAAKNIKDEWDN